MDIKMVCRSINSYSGPSMDAPNGKRKTYNVTLEADPKDAGNKANGIVSGTLYLTTTEQTEFELDQSYVVCAGDEDE